MKNTHASIVPRQAHEPGVPQVVGEEVQQPETAVAEGHVVPPTKPLR